MKTIRMRRLSNGILFVIILMFVMFNISENVQAADSYDYSSYSIQNDKGFARMIYVTNKDDPNGETTIAYCFNMDKHYPNLKDSSVVQYYARHEASEDVLVRSIQNPDYYKDNKELFRLHIIKVILLGYDNNKEGLLNGLTPEEMYDVTQNAIWHFTDRSVRADYYGYDVESFINTHFYGNNPKFANPEKAEKAFREMISDNDLDKYANAKLDFYETENRAYQNLIAAKRLNEPANNDGKLSLTKKISGNIADYDNEFQFSIKITDTEKKTLATGSYLIKSEKEEVDAGTFSGMLTVGLKNNEMLEIIGLPDNFTYDVVENGAEDYTTYINDEISTKKKISGNENDATIIFENTKNTPVPTGLENHNTERIIVILINLILLILLL